MVAQINQVAITTEIVKSYTSDFDGTTYDTIQMTYPDGTTETRTGWVEENLDGETTFYLRASKGTVLNSAWKSTQNNKWLIAYKHLWMQRYQAECKAFQQSMDTLAHPEFYTPEEYAQAKADLGF
ncbi:hypothetical protein [Planktothrix mougeotii]|uniref:Uncharacterized protein n=1 Tax=Planktothrix mougeotii LEGE 06226 TaxID=1828728 RepID=A0ABR9UEL5_9CYAN|nr:hypothetical protein [Planktothrix mougeotii]MBE9144900.1 hypothetical protein [Planktothrix mougeotii LEGE 06226]